MLAFLFEGNEDIATRFDADVSPDGFARPCIRIVRVCGFCRVRAIPEICRIGQTTNLTKTCLQFNRNSAGCFFRCQKQTFSATFSSDTITVNAHIPSSEPLPLPTSHSTRSYANSFCLPPTPRVARPPSTGVSTGLLARLARTRS